MLKFSRLCAAASILVPILFGACSRKGDATSGHPSTRGGDEGDAAPAASKVKVVLNWIPEPEFAGLYVARDSGAYAARQLDVEILGGGAGAPVIQMVAAGQVDFGIAGGDEVILARSRGADIVAVFATFQTHPQGIMVHAARHLTSIDQALSSGMLAIEPGLPYAAFLKKRYGFQGAQVTPYDGGTARFLAQPQLSQQCYIASEPILAKLAGGDPQVFLIADTGYNPYGAVVVTRGELVRRERDKVVRFVAATADGWRAYLHDPTEGNRVVGRLNSTMSPQMLEQAAAAQAPLILPKGVLSSRLGMMTADRWRTLASQLHELGLVGEGLDPNAMFAELGDAVPPERITR